MWLARLSVRRPVLMTMVIGFLVVLGVVSWPRMPVELLPDVGIPYLLVRTVWPGAGPEDVQSGLLVPLEEVLGKVNRLKTLRTSAVPDAGLFILEMESGTDVDATLAQVRSLLDDNDGLLPEGARRPVLTAVDLNATPVVRLAITSDRAPVDLSDWVRDNVVLPWSRIDDVGSVDTVGIREREYQVEVDQGLLLSHRLTLGHVVEAVRAGGADIPGGILKDQRNAVPVRFAGAYGSVEALKNAVIRAPLGELVGLDQVARVEAGISPETSRARFNGRPGVGIAVFKRANANTVALGRELRGALQRLQARAPPDIQVDLVLDASRSIESSIRDLISTMGLCVLLTALVLWLFLHDWRGTAIISVSIPASVVGSLTFLHFTGHTVNYMTLMGLAISIGSLVDASIVVLESIDSTARTTEDPGEAAATGTGRVVLGVLGSITTNLAVFAPVAFLQGIVGRFFVPFAMAIVFSTSVSLLISFTLTPMLASWLYRRRSTGRPLDPVSRAWDWGYARFSETYRQAIRWSVTHRRPAAMGFVILFAGAILLLGPVVSMGFLPNPDQGFFVGQVILPRGTSLDTTARAVERVEAILVSDPHVERVYAEVGQYNTLFGILAASNRAELQVSLRDTPDRPRTAQVIEGLRPLIAQQVPGPTVFLKELGGAESAVREDILVELFGSDPAVLSTLARRVEAALEAQPNVVDVLTMGDEVSPQVSVVPDPARVARAGLTPAQVGLLLRAAVEGDTQARVREGDRIHPIRVRFREQDRTDMAALAATTVQTASGAQVPLRELARVELSLAPALITRQDRERRVVTSANLAWGAVGDTSKAITRLLEAQPLPEGYRIRIGGEEEQRAEAAAEIGGALVLALVLIYMLLAGLMESFVHPLTLLTTVPFGLIGVMTALVGTGVALDIFGLMALVMLIGIVVNNAILMIEETHHLQSEGWALAPALEEGGMRRLRAILMTSLTTVVGMVPLALGMGEGAEIRQAMAIVSIGGVGVSSVLILVACPVFYHLVEDARGWLHRRRSEGRP